LQHLLTFTAFATACGAILRLLRTPMEIFQWNDARRLSGLATRRLKPGEAPYMALQTNESSSPNSIETFDFYRLHRSERSDLPFVRL